MKFSVAQMLYGMVVFAFIAAVIGAGANGSPIAYGIGVSLCTLVFYFAFFAMLYWGTLLIAGTRRRIQKQPVQPHPLDTPTETET